MTELITPFGWKINILIRRRTKKLDKQSLVSSEMLFVVLLCGIVLTSFVSVFF